MRIIAGEARGRRLRAPVGRGTTRPILDALKERIFNILSADIPDARVWDLFAGSGSIGLEALSRGAKQCVFVERDAKTFAVLKQNIEDLGYAERSDAKKADVMKGACAAAAREGIPDLIFLDPPFPLMDNKVDEFRAFLEGFVQAPFMGPESRLILRTPEGFDWPDGEAPKGLELADRREHGASLVLFYRLFSAE